jgi:predicted Zn-dependent protease
MWSRWMLSPAVAILVPLATVGTAEDRWGPGSRGYGGSFPTATVPAAVSGSGSRSWANYPYPYYGTVTADGVPIVLVPTVPLRPPTIVIVQPPAGPGWGGMGLAGPLPPRGVPKLRPRVAAPQKKADPAKANQLVTVGDRLFRAGNVRRAAERYEQAVRANPHSAAPRVRLAQVALGRGRYDEAANQLREAQAAEPEWLARATDIQTIYSEPGDFARQIARLESHLQASPHDRNAWLVLGAQWYLTGRTRQAADVFLRLSDRRPDATLAAFLDAARPADVR